MNKHQADILVSNWSSPVREKLETAHLVSKERSLTAYETPSYAIILSDLSSVIEARVRRELESCEPLESCDYLSIVLEPHEEMRVVVKYFLSLPYSHPSTVDVLLHYLIQGNYIRRAAAQAIKKLYPI